MNIIREYIGIGISVYIVKNLAPRFKHINKAYSDIVKAPIIEELAFRLALTGGIRRLQNLCSNASTTHQQHKNRIFRHLVSGISFGLAHLGNEDSSVGRVIVHSINGVIYSDLSERYTTGSSILAHSMHNLAIICKDEGISTIPHLLVSVMKTIFIFMFVLKF
jgi:membrane protease YdiL (CAAX protease family)